MSAADLVRQLDELHPLERDRVAAAVLATAPTAALLAEVNGRLLNGSDDDFVQILGFDVALEEIERLRNEAPNVH